MVLSRIRRQDGWSGILLYTTGPSTWEEITFSLGALGALGTLGGVAAIGSLCWLMIIVGLWWIIVDFSGL